MSQRMLAVAVCALFALTLVMVSGPAELLAQRQGAAKGGNPGPPGGGDPVDPLDCFDVGGGSIPTQNTFTQVATLAPSSSVYPDSLMFGRPLVAELDGSHIVVAVGSRGPNRLHVFRLDPNNLGAPAELAVAALADAPRRVVSAFFNNDSLPDFVVSGFGAVDVLVSPDYSPVTIRSEGDGIAATDGYIAVGVKGGGKRDPGEVFIYEVVPGPPFVVFNELGASLVGPSNGSKFGDDVALGDLDGDPELDLVVGASGWKPASAGRKDSSYGIALAYEDFLSMTPGPETTLAEGNAKNENLGWQVEIANEQIFVATKWSTADRRVEVLPFGILPPPTRELEPEAGNLGNGWASGDIGVGSITAGLSAIVGAPNAHCEGFEHSTGVSYLYEGLSETPTIFVPPHSPSDPIPADWNAFGWSNGVISTGGSDFVIIGEPGFRAGGRVYVYRR